MNLSKRIGTYIHGKTRGNVNRAEIRNVHFIRPNDIIDNLPGLTKSNNMGEAGAKTLRLYKRICRLVIVK